MQTLPCAIALLVFAKPLLAVLFHYGHFEVADVMGTVPALQGYGLGLLGIVSVKILAPGYFAQLDTKTPVRIAIAVLVFTQLMNVLFIYGLHIGVGGLALSIGLGATLNACWLLVGLIRLGVYKPRPGWFPFLAKLLVAALALGACLVWADRSIDWFDRAHPGLRALKMAGVLGGVALVYAAVLTALGVRLKEFVRKA
jgi:putative peptidoglycan lipid II flippase